MRRIILLAAVGMVFCGLPVNGALITIGIEAEVDDVHDADNYLEGRINVGDLITGSYTYDTDTPDSNPLPGVGDYEYFAYPSGFSLSVGGLDFMTDPANTDFLIEIVNNFPGDAYSVISYRNLALSDATSVNNISWGLRDYSASATAISSIDLPTTAPVLDDWPTNFLDIGGGPRSRVGFSFSAHVTSAVVIPEPTTILLVGMGGLIFVRRIKK